MSSEKCKEIFDKTNFTLSLSGVYGIPQLAELLDFLKGEKEKTIETAFKIGDQVYRRGYRDYGIGEIVEIEITIWNSGEPHIVFIAESLGSGYEGEFEKA